MSDIDRPAQVRNAYKPELRYISKGRYRDEISGNLYEEVPVVEIAALFDSTHIVYPKALGGLNVLRPVKDDEEN